MKPNIRNQADTFSYGVMRGTDGSMFSDPSWEAKANRRQLRGETPSASNHLV